MTGLSAASGAGIDGMASGKPLPPSKIRTIDEERQNKPTLIVRDLLRYGITTDAAYEILLRRGVFKWFAVRRGLIRLKDAWRDDITRVMELLRYARAYRRFYGGGSDYCIGYWRGYLKAAQTYRGEVSALRHSPRMRVQDDDKLARKWFLRHE